MDKIPAANIYADMINCPVCGAPREKYEIADPQVLFFDRRAARGLIARDAGDARAKMAHHILREPGAVEAFCRRAAPLIAYADILFRV